MAPTAALVQGREALARQQWRQAYERLAAADRKSPLRPPDLERLATAAYLVGEDVHAVAIWTRAHNRLVSQGQALRAARCGFWLGLKMLLAGEIAQATGWLARSQRLLGESEAECVERGYGLVVSGLLSMGRGDIESAGDAFEAAILLAERHSDPDLLALGLLGRGQSLIYSRRIAEGVARLDEAMLGITAGHVSPVLAGIVYCAVILTCQRIFDLRRAGEWTRQLDAWCASQADLVPYRGRCLLHRAEVLQLRGDWKGALAEVTKARAHLAEEPKALGSACYQQAELHRLRGELALALERYQEASRHGYEPQPGLSLLRLAEGRTEAAVAAIRGYAASVGPPGGGDGTSRARVLGPHVEISLASGDLATARAAAEELTEIATDIDAPFLLASATQATGAVLIAEGKPKAALALLREAWAIWERLEAPYEAARVRVLVGRACRQMGDVETALMHFHAARSAFGELRARPDVAALDRLLDGGHGGPSTGLTDREREVLACVASGGTNRQVATTLGISEHTVARHLSNIFDKLGVTTRTAASAFAHEHELVPPPAHGQH